MILYIIFILCYNNNIIIVRRSVNSKYKYVKTYKKLKKEKTKKKHKKIICKKSRIKSRNARIMLQQINRIKIYY